MEKIEWGHSILSLFKNWPECSAVCTNYLFQTGSNTFAFVKLHSPREMNIQSTFDDWHLSWPHNSAIMVAAIWASWYIWCMHVWHQNGAQFCQVQMMFFLVTNKPFKTWYVFRINISDSLTKLAAIHFQMRVSSKQTFLSSVKHHHRGLCFCCQIIVFITFKELFKKSNLLYKEILEIVT